MRQLFRFHGGVHPPEHKAVSSAAPIVQARLPQRLVIPLRQHIGTSARPCVAVGDKVLKGQMIGRADGYVSAAVHASTSGAVVAIEMRPAAHPSGLSDLCVVLDADGDDRWIERTPLDLEHMDASYVRNRLRDLGLAGLGGAVFPSFIKLNPGAPAKVSTLVINGAECEPWITCDDRLMRERAQDILTGARIMATLLHSTNILVGVEDNKPEALAALQAAARSLDVPADIVAVPTLYPGGGAKQLIKVLTGKEAPSGGRSTDIGVQCFNVGTAYALARAVQHGEPLVSRIVSVTGAVARPQNYEVLLGTPMAELLEQAGHTSEANGVIMGGPMMGFDIADTAAPVVKATNCLLVKSPRLFPPPPRAMPCIRCGACARACPARLQPQELYWFARAKNFGKAQEYHLFDCIECGCCNYVCPSHLPLVDYYRYAKSEIWAREQEKNAADLARRRHESRVSRQEREKVERAERLAAKAPVKKAQATVPPDSAEAAARKALIAETLARVQAKQAGTAPENIDTNSSS